MGVMESKAFSKPININISPPYAIGESVVKAVVRKISREVRLTQPWVHDSDLLEKQAKMLSERLLRQGEAPEDAVRILNYEINRRAAAFARKYPDRANTLEKSIRWASKFWEMPLDEVRRTVYKKEVAEQETLPFPLVTIIIPRKIVSLRRMDPEGAKEGDYSATSMQELKESTAKEYERRYMHKNFPRLNREISGWSQTVYEGLARSAVLDREERNIERSEIKLHPDLISFFSRASFCNGDLADALTDKSHDMTDIAGKNLVGVLFRQGMYGSEVAGIISDYIDEALHWEHPSVRKLIAERMREEYDDWHRFFIESFPQYRKFAQDLMDARRASQHG
jgi:hypothetical protein